MTAPWPGSRSPSSAPSSRSSGGASSGLLSDDDVGEAGEALEPGTSAAVLVYENRPVVINLQRVRKEQAIRIIDFLSGTVYALGGSIHKLGSHIFMCTPANVDIQGTISDMLAEDTKDLLR